MFTADRSFPLVFVLVDDWYQRKARLSPRQTGAKTEFLDCEVITLIAEEDFYSVSLWDPYIGLHPRKLSDSVPG
jgi:hypothetical protein